MELITKAPKGTVDIVPGKSEKWQVVEDVFRSEAEGRFKGENLKIPFRDIFFSRRGTLLEKQVFYAQRKRLIQNALVFPRGPGAAEFGKFLRFPEGGVLAH